MATTWSDHFESLTGIAPAKILRLAMIIGGYILLRPMIELFFRKALSSPDEDDAVSMFDPRALRSKASTDDGEHERGDVATPSVSTSAEQDGVIGTTSGNWGDGLRRREVKRAEEEHDRRVKEQQDEEELKEIQEFLEGD